jgi:hypothetical protein
MDALLGFGGLAFGLIVTLWSAVRSSELAAPLSAGFALRASLACIDALFARLPGANDGAGWDRVAAYFARNGIEGTFEYIGTGHNLYIWGMSVFYALLGRSPFLIQSINVVLGTMMIGVVYNLSLELCSDVAAARRAAWLIALFPSLIFFSSVLLREVAVSLPLLVSVLYLVRWYKTRRLGLAVAALCFLLVSMAFHSGGLAVLLFAGIWLIGVWVRALLTGRLEGVARNTVALVIGLAVVAWVLASGFSQQKFHGLETGDIAALSERQEGFAQGRTAYLEGLHATSAADLIWQTPIRLVYFLFAPFPWMLHTGSDAFGFVDSMLFVVLVVRVARNRKELANNPTSFMTLGVFSAMAIVFAIGVSNYGTALRHRNKMLPLLIAAAMSLPGRVRLKAQESTSRPRHPARA